MAADTIPCFHGVLRKPLMEYRKMDKHFSKNLAELEDTLHRLKNQYQIKGTYTAEEAKGHPIKKEGLEYSQNPEIPSNPSEAFELFKNYYAVEAFEREKYFFVRTYKMVNIHSIQAEINELEKWIAEAQNENYTNACRFPEDQNRKHEYLRLVNGFYDGHLMTRQHHSSSSLSAEVFGRYVHFYNFLQSELERLFEANKVQLSPITAGNEELNPIIKPEALDEVYSLLKNYFHPNEQPILNKLLQTGISEKAITFLDNGNKLADSLNKLREHGILIYCTSKKELENWIITNFKFVFRKEIKSFSTDYIEKCISRNHMPCKNPLFEIKDGKIRANA